MTDSAETGAAMEDRASWLGIAVELPWAGPWIALGLLVIPAVVILLALSALGLIDMLAEEEVVGRREWLAMAIAGAATLGWLRFLRRRTGVSLTFYFIPCIWLASAFTAMAAAGAIFGF